MRRRWQLQVGVLAGMFVGSLALRVILDQMLSLADSTFYNHWLPMQLNLFALGMGLALLGEALRRQVVPARIVALLDSRLLPWVCWGLAAASFAAVSFWVHVGVSEFYHPLGHDLALQVLYGVTALLLLFPDTVRPLRRGVSPKVLAGIPLRQLGLVSYGIYLWQDIVIDQYLRRTHHRSFSAPFLPALLWVGAVTTLIATVSYCRDRAPGAVAQAPPDPALASGVPDAGRARGRLARAPPGHRYDADPPRAGVVDLHVGRERTCGP